jgi:hypothetical protein
MIIAVSNRLHRGLFVTFLTAKGSPFTIDTPLQQYHRK